jgi:hypothetical protein
MHHELASNCYVIEVATDVHIINSAASHILNGKLRFLIIDIHLLSHNNSITD